MCVFSHFSILLIHGSLLHFLHTSKPFQFHFVISFLFKSSFTSCLFFKTFPLISPNIILIWVTTHIHTKYQDLLGFDQNPNSISFHLTMNPTTKKGFHNYLVLCGYTNLNFKKSKVRIQFYQNPRFRDRRLTISSLKFHVIHTKSIPFWLGSPSSSSLLPLPPLFFSLFTIFLPSQMRPIWS